MARTFGDMMDDGGETERNWFRRQTPLKLSLKVIGVGLVLALVFGAIGFISGWWRTGADVISPENVTEQWRFAYQFEEDLGSIARQWCTAKQAETQATTSDAKDQRQTQRIAQENNYTRVASDYNARLRNAFEAKLVAPPDVPTRAPTLEEKVKALSLTC